MQTSSAEPNRTRSRMPLPFVTLWAGQSVSFIGSQATSFALSIWLFETTGLATAISLVALSYAIPAIVITLFAGAIVDRFNRKALMVSADIVTAAVTCAYLALFMAGQLQAWHVYVGAILVGVVEPLHALAFDTSSTLMVDKANYQRISAMTTLTVYSSRIISAPLAALLYPITGLGGVMALDLATFIFAVVVTLLVRIPQPAVRASQSDARPIRQLVDTLTYGFRWIFAHRAMLVLLLLFAFYQIFIAFTDALRSPMLIALNDDSGVTLSGVLAVGGVAGVVTSLAVSAWKGFGHNRIHAIFLGMVFAGMGKIGLSLARDFPTWAVWQAIMTPVWVVMFTTYMALWRSKVPPDAQGRVFAARKIATTLCSQLGFVIAGPFADFWAVPGMSSGGSLVGALGGLLGEGVGAGLSLAHLLGALGLVGIGFGGYLFASARNVDRRVPDFDETPRPATSSVMVGVSA